MLTVGSLFAGIGGFDLAAARLGWRTVWHSEIDPYAAAVFAQHFPHSRNVGDITTWSPGERDRVDLICGGFPCQDISLAGKGAGISGKRSGLWSHFERVVGVLEPDYVVVENVPALLSRGIDRVLGDLAALGYDAEWECIPASAVGAPHRRDRIWIVAYPNSESVRQRQQRGEQLAPVSGEPVAAQLGEAVPHPASGRRAVRGSAQGSGTGQPAQPREDVADSQVDEERAGLRQGESRGLGRGRPADGSGEMADAMRGRWEGPSERGSVRSSEPGGSAGGQAGPPVLDTGRELLEGWQPREPDQPANPWAVEPDVGRVAHGIPSRVDRLTCLGNALVPQVAEWIFRQIQEAELR